jgi:hypothetical protein
MKSTSLTRQMTRCFEQFSADEQQRLLQMMKTVLMNKKNKGTEYTIEDYNKELPEAEAAFMAGHYITHEEMERQVKLY